MEVLSHQTVPCHEFESARKPPPLAPPIYIRMSNLTAVAGSVPNTSPFVKVARFRFGAASSVNPPVVAARAQQEDPVSCVVPDASGSRFSRNLVSRSKLAVRFVTTVRPCQPPK